MFKKFLNNILYNAMVLSFVAIGLGLLHIGLVQLNVSNTIAFCLCSGVLCLGICFYVLTSDNIEDWALQASAGFLLCLVSVILITIALKGIVKQIVF